MAAITIEAQRESLLERRLPWLLVFRVGVATVLLIVALVADLLGWNLSRFTSLLYAVIIGTYLMVLVEGVLLRSRVSRVVLSSVHLAGALGIALAIVQGTGGVLSPFSFLYLLAILDAAIIAGRRAAFIVASLCSVGYGVQLVLQMYRILPAGAEDLPTSQEFSSAVVIHLGAFYLIALLAGRLALMLDAAWKTASTAQVDLQRVLEFHASVLESLPLGVLTVDPTGHVSTANQAAAWILDTPSSALIGQDLPRFLQDFMVGEESHCTVTRMSGDKESQLFLGKSQIKRAGVGDIVPPKIDFTLLILEDRSEREELERRLSEQESGISLVELDEEE